MTSTFEKLQAQLEARRCPTCDGLGEYDDLELGDIAGNTYICQNCKGSGFKPKEPTPWTSKRNLND